MARNLHNFVFFLSLFLSAAVLRANDGSFYAAGGSLFPLKETVVQLQKENLSFRLDSAAKHVYVDVFFEFFNPGPEKELTVGFVTPPANGDIDDRQMQHPQIRDFTVVMNGQPLEWKVWRASESGFKIGEDVATGSDFVYFFKAVFKPGANQVRHTYSHKVSSGIEMLFYVDYRITTGKMWANGAIGEFNLSIETGDYYWALPWSFSEDGKDPVEWQLSGPGRIIREKQYSFLNDSLPLRMLRTKKGAKLSCSIKNFRPDRDLFFYARQPFEMYLSGLSAVFGDPKKDAVGAYYSLANDTTEALALQDWEIQALKNLLYARHGYVFKNEKWKNYFEKQDWYYPVPELSDPPKVFDPMERQLFGMLLYAEKQKKKKK